MIIFVSLFRCIISICLHILGHGGLSAISTRPSTNPSTPSSTTELRSPTQNVSSCVAGGGGTNNSMLVMSGGEGYIDFRLGKETIFPSLPQYI